MYVSSFQGCIFQQKSTYDYLSVDPKKMSCYMGSKKYNKGMTNIVKHLKRWCNSCEDQVVTHPCVASARPSCLESFRQRGRDMAQAIT